MAYAVCIIPLAHVRNAPDHRAEMSSQALFGECLRITEMLADGWFAAEQLFDNYYGFCRLNQFMLLDAPLQSSNQYTGEWVSVLHFNGQKMMLPYGCDLSMLQQPIPGVQVKYSGHVHDANLALPAAETLEQTAKLFLHTSYLWGGRSVFGIDCSGFVQGVYKMINISLPRDANMQVAKGEGVGFLQEAQCGDLAFFDDEHGDIIHVGMMLNAGEIIHSSGQVRIDPIDNEGIIHTGTRQRTHKLRIIKRML